MFAITGEGNEIDISENEIADFFVNGGLWFSNAVKIEFVTMTGHYVWFLKFGVDKYLVIEPYSAGGTPCNVYGVRNGQWYLSDISGYGMSLRINEIGELVYTHTTYDLRTTNDNLDGMIHTWKDYWLYYDEKTHGFKEYGGVLITLEQFESFKNADDIIASIDGYELRSIYYRANGIININYRIPYYPSDNEQRHNAVLYDNYYITVRYRNREIIGKDTEKIENWSGSLNDGGGVYLSALNPDIVVYPTFSKN
jgi:hypothetical protein